MVANKWKAWKSGTAVALGLGLGVVLGLVLDNLVLWLALGLILGVLGEVAIAKDKSSRE